VSGWGANLRGTVDVRRLGEILVKESLITQDQLQKALEFSAQWRQAGSCLTKMGFINDDESPAVLSRPVWRSFHKPEVLRIDPNVIKLIRRHASRYQVIPLSRVGSVLPSHDWIYNVLRWNDIKFMTDSRRAGCRLGIAIGDAITRFMGGRRRIKKKSAT